MVDLEAKSIKHIHLKVSKPRIISHVRSSLQETHSKKYMDRRAKQESSSLFTFQNSMTPVSHSSSTQLSSALIQHWAKEQREREREREKSVVYFLRHLWSLPLCRSCVFIKVVERTCAVIHVLKPSRRKHIVALLCCALRLSR